MSEKIQVVSAAIVNLETKRILLAQRSGDTTYPWKWCTPGGKVNDNEYQLEALRRELREELHVELSIDDVGREVYIRDIRSTRTGAMCTVWCYLVPHTAIRGVPACGDKTIGLGWFDTSEFVRLRLAPADDAERVALMELLT